MWVLRKLYYLIKAAAIPIIVYTDYTATTGIIKQTIINITLVERLNLYLVYTLIYI